MESNNGSTAGLIVGLVLAALIIAAAIIYGLPYLRNMQDPQQPSNINITIPVPTPDPAPSPQP